MTNYKDLGFAVNAGSGNIEYVFASSERLADSVSVTLENFLSENPGKTSEAFAEWKRISDEDYLDEKHDDYNTTRLNITFEWAEQEGKCFIPSPEDVLTAAIFEQEERAREAKRRELGLRAFRKLTDIQQRRYKMYHVDGLTTREIAEIEGISHVAVVYSLEQANKKIKKFLSNG